MTFRLAHISDTHLSGRKPFFIDNFERTVAALAAAVPDLVLNSGDLSLDGANAPDDLAVARRLHDATGLPVRFIPGNHDIGQNAGVATSHEAPIDALRRERYVRLFGPDWWALDVPGWRLLAVDAQLLGSDLEAAREQDAFIADAAADARGRRMALLTHKPLFDRTADETLVGGRFLNPAPRRRLLAMLGGRCPDLVASGHVHQYRVTDAHGGRHVWAPSTAFVIPDTHQPRYGLKQVGYVEHRLHPDGTHDCRLVAVPGATTLDIADFPDAYGPMEAHGPIV
jgi:3',5'-cyclic AMP phosphodiesterase CpdA